MPRRWGGGAPSARESSNLEGSPPRLQAGTGARTRCRRRTSPDSVLNRGRRRPSEHFASKVGPCRPGHRWSLRTRAETSPHGGGKQHLPTGACLAMLVVRALACQLARLARGLSLPCGLWACGQCLARLVGGACLCLWLGLASACGLAWLVLVAWVGLWLVCWCLACACAWLGLRACPFAGPSPPAPLLLNPPLPVTD